MLDLSDSSISSTDMQALMKTMYAAAGLPENSDIDFENFAKIFASDEYESTLRGATLGIEGKSKLRGLECRGHFQTILTYIRLRALFPNIEK